MGALFPVPRFDLLPRFPAYISPVTTPVTNKYPVNAVSAFRERLSVDQQLRTTSASVKLRIPHPGAIVRREFQILCCSIAPGLERPLHNKNVHNPFLTGKHAKRRLS